MSLGLAEHVARLLVIDERASQSAYLVMDHLNHNDPLVLAFEQQARARLGEALDVRELAAAIGTSGAPSNGGPGCARHEPTRARAASAGRARRPSAAHHGAERRADRAAGGLRQCGHAPFPAAASPDGPASPAIARGQEPSPIRAGAARFTPPARTARHCHAVGQTLCITEGHGLHRPRGGQIEEIRAGDIICTPAGEWHRHGAAPGHFMTHLSVIEAVPGDERPEASWGEHVTDEDYHQR